MTKLRKILESCKVTEYYSGLREDIFAIERERKGKTKVVKGTLDELMIHFKYTIKNGQDHGLKKKLPKSIYELVKYLNQAAEIVAPNGEPEEYFEVGDPEDPTAIQA